MMKVPKRILILSPLLTLVGSALYFWFPGFVFESDIRTIIVTACGHAPFVEKAEGTKRAYRKSLVGLR